MRNLRDPLRVVVGLLAGIYLYLGIFQMHGWPDRAALGVFLTPLILLMVGLWIHNFSAQGQKCAEIEGDRLER